MKIIYKITKLSAICLMLISVCVFTACDSDDENSTQIVLNSFGPSPALRGGELRFIGSNLNLVQAVEIPGSDAITDIQVVNEREIKVTIPQNAAVGLVVLKTPQGDITTVTNLTYSEPIAVESITSGKVKAGSPFTIKGDYLNLIAEVIFFDGAVVSQENFISQSRKGIVVTVPAEAQPGKIRVSNGAEIPVEVYSDVAANITEPVINSVSPLIIKPGNTIKISGTDLDLTSSVVFAGNVIVSEFTVSEDNKELTVKVPLAAQDGAIILVAKSTLEYTTSDALTMVVPTSLVATPAANIRPNDVITISGKDLDLVTSLLFFGMEETVNPQSVSGTRLTALLPAAAQSGEVILNMANGKTVSVAIMTKKPVVSTYTPSPVTAGGTLTVKGTDLDLVSSVTFGGDVTSEVISATLTALTVVVPVDAVSGTLVLTMENGETVTASSLDIVTPLFCFVPVLPGADVEIKSGTIMALEVANGDKLTNVKVNGTATQFILKGTELNILVPKNSMGATTFTLVSSNGEVSYTLNITYSGIMETVIFETETDLGAWSASFRLYKETFTAAGFKAGSIVRMYLTPNGGWPLIQMNHANWGAVAMPEGSAVMEITDVVFTQDMINTMMNANDGWSTTALIIQGQQAIIHKVSLVVEH